MGDLDDTVLVDHTAVVASRRQAVVAAESLVAGGVVGGIASIADAVGGREPVGAQLPRHTATRGQGVLQTLGEGNKAVAAMDHLAIAPAAPGQAVVEEHVRERFTAQGDLHPLELGEIAEANLTWLVRQGEHHLG